MVDYHEYIKSNEWKMRRDMALERADYKCQLCNRSKKETVLHVHHRSYQNLGSEKLSDLTVLCSSCHNAYHERKNKDRAKAIDLDSALALSWQEFFRWLFWKRVICPLYKLSNDIGAQILFLPTLNVILIISDDIADIGYDISTGVRMANRCLGKTPYQAIVLDGLPTAHEFFVFEVNSEVASLPNGATELTRFIDETKSDFLRFHKDRRYGYTAAFILEQIDVDGSGYFFKCSGIPPGDWGFFGEDSWYGFGDMIISRYAVACMRAHIIYGCEVNGGAPVLHPGDYGLSSIPDAIYTIDTSVFS